MPSISNAIAFFHEPGLNEDQGARALPHSYTFSTSTAALQSFTASLADVGLNTVQMLYVDNSQSPAPTQITINGTYQNIIVPPFSQGYFRVLGSPLQLDYSILNYGVVAGASASFNVNLHWLNIVPDGADNWVTQPWTGAQGTPYAASGVGANSSIGLTMAAQVGRQSFISELSITGGGATAASIVTATLSNIAKTNVAVTLNFKLAIPAGATVGLQPFVMSFNPPIPVVSGQSALLTVPAFGAGNTDAAATLNGYWV